MFLTGKYGELVIQQIFTFKYYLLGLQMSVGYGPNSEKQCFSISSLILVFHLAKEVEYLFPLFFFLFF